jgi:hypothetical protein
MCAQARRSQRSRHMHTHTHTYDTMEVCGRPYYIYIYIYDTMEVCGRPYYIYMYIYAHIHTYIHSHKHTYRMQSTSASLSGEDTRQQTFSTSWDVLSVGDPMRERPPSSSSIHFDPDYDQVPSLACAKHVFSGLCMCLCARVRACVPVCVCVRMHTYMHAYAIVHSQGKSCSLRGDQ